MTNHTYTSTPTQRTEARTSLKIVAGPGPTAKAILETISESCFIGNGRLKSDPVHPQPHAIVCGKKQFVGIIAGNCPALGIALENFLDVTPIYFV